MLPILHLNGFKIASPTVLARIGDEELDLLLRGYGYRPYVVEGDEPEAMHESMATALDDIVDEIRRIQQAARGAGFDGAPALARAGVPLAEGLDRTAGSGRQEDRGLVAIAPGADGRDAREA